MDLTSLYELNYAPFLLHTKADLSSLASISLSWCSCINSIKMYVFPKNLYLFQNLPIKLPQAFFHKLNSLLLKCIWKTSCPRLNHRILCHPSPLGEQASLTLKYMKRQLYSCVFSTGYTSLHTQTTLYLPIALGHLLALQCFPRYSSSYLVCLSTDSTLMGLGPLPL